MVVLFVFFWLVKVLFFVEWVLFVNVYMWDIFLKFVLFYVVFVWVRNVDGERLELFLDWYGKFWYEDVWLIF